MPHLAIRTHQMKVVMISELCPATEPPGRAKVHNYSRAIQRPLQASPSTDANEHARLNCIIYVDNSGIVITGLKLNYITISITK